MIEREETAECIRLRSDSCTFVYERLKPGVMLVRIFGYDKGELGTAPLDELVAELARFSPIELFVDASTAHGATWNVSQQWMHWFRANQDRLTRVNILVRGKYIQQTILVAKELSRTRDLLNVCSDARRFQDRLRAQVPSWGGSNVPQA